VRPGGLFPACCALLVALCACQTERATRRKVYLPSGVAAEAVLFYPVGLRWEQPAWRALELSQRLLDLAVPRVGEQALLFGPSEFTVHRAEDDNAWAASTAVLRLVPYGIAPERAVVVRAWAERHQQTGRRELVDAQGQARGSSAVEETRYLGHVEVLHPSSRTLLVQVAGEAAVDPFSERADEGADPAPELTRLMELLTREALAALEPVLRPPRQASPPLGRVALVPWQALALAPQLEAMDMLDADLLRQQRLRFANPALPLELLARLTALPAGLYVLEAPEGGQLAPGELVVSVEGAPALPHVLARARLAPRPLTARIRRVDGSYQERLLP
jgi:hypothetical protein